MAKHTQVSDGTGAMQDWAKFAGFGAFLIVALVGSLLWALNYPMQQSEWTCVAEQPFEQSTSVPVYKSIRCEPKHVAGKNEGASETAGIKLTDALIVVFTFGLLVVGALQVYWLQLTMNATALAARAADLSARAAIGVELPIIRVTPDKLHSLGTRINDDAIKVFYGVSGVTFANLGNTKAFPVEVRSGIVYGDDLPSKPRYTSVDTFLPNLMFDPDPKVTPFKRLTDCSTQVADGDGDLIDKGKFGLWFYCCLVYYDFMQTRHEAAFCWRWTNTGMGMAWRPDGAPAYNHKT